MGIFLMVELRLNALPFSFHYGVFVVLFGTTYLIWSWIYFHLEGIWDYFFLDTSKNINVLWQFAVFSMHVLSWCFIFNLAKCRDRRRQSKEHGKRLLGVTVNGTTTTDSIIVGVETEEI